MKQAPFEPGHPEQDAFDQRASMWLTQATSKRERYAYRDGHYAGWESAVKWTAGAERHVSYVCPQCFWSLDTATLGELRAVLCGVGVVGQIDGHDVIRRDSVIGLIDRRIAALPALLEQITDDNKHGDAWSAATPE